MYLPVLLSSDSSYMLLGQLSILEHENETWNSHLLLNRVNSILNVIRRNPKLDLYLQYGMNLGACTF